MDASGQVTLEHSFTGQLRNALGQLDITQMRTNGLDHEIVPHLRLQHLRNLEQLAGVWVEYYGYVSSISLAPEINMSRVARDYPKILEVCFGADCPRVALLPANLVRSRQEEFTHQALVTDAFVFLQVCAHIFKSLFILF